MNVHQHIVEAIKEQLYLNDYLVLPEFGGFVLKTKRAHFSASGNVLHPPTKTVGFNAQLKQNDGILTNTLQEKLNCSAIEAKNHLSDFAVFCNSVLQSKRRLSLNDIGFFYLDFENNICFEPDANINFNNESFGLNALQVIPLEIKEQAKPISKKKLEERVITEIVPAEKISQKINIRRTTRIAATIVIIMAFLFLIVNNTNINGVLKSTLFSVGGAKKYTPIQYSELNKINLEKKEYTFVADNNGIAVFELNKNKSIAVNVENTNGIESNSKISKYEIILGCFKKIRNAKRLVKELCKHGVRASIKEKAYKGMHVVSVLGINNKIEAIDKLEEIQNNFPNAWMKVN